MPGPLLSWRCCSWAPAGCRWLACRQACPTAAHLRYALAPASATRKNVAPGDYLCGRTRGDPHPHAVLRPSATFFGLSAVASLRVGLPDDMPASGNSSGFPASDSRATREFSMLSHADCAPEQVRRGRPNHRDESRRRRIVVWFASAERASYLDNGQRTFPSQRQEQPAFYAESGPPISPTIKPDTNAEERLWATAVRFIEVTQFSEKEYLVSAVATPMESGLGRDPERSPRSGGDEGSADARIKAPLRDCVNSSAGGRGNEVRNAAPRNRMRRSATGSRGPRRSGTRSRHRCRWLACRQAARLGATRHSTVRKTSRKGVRGRGDGGPHAFVRQDSP